MAALTVSVLDVVLYLHFECVVAVIPVPQFEVHQVTNSVVESKQLIFLLVVLIKLLNKLVAVVVSDEVD